MPASAGYVDRALLSVVGIVPDAGECGADLLDKAVSEALLPRFVVVLRAGDVLLGGRGEDDQAVQGAGCRRSSRSITSSAGRAAFRSCSKVRIRSSRIRRVSASSGCSGSASGRVGMRSGVVPIEIILRC